VLVRKDIGQISPMGFSDRGSFYYNTAVSVVDVFEGSLDLAKGTIVEPPKKIIQRVTGTNYSAEWSPDGRYLAYVSERQTASSRSSYVLCIRFEQTGEEREVPLAIDSFWTMRWAADGRAVFATMTDKTTQQGLFKIDIQTGAYTPLARGVANESLIKSFAVSPDGKSVYYARFQYAKNLATIARYDLETGREVEIYRKTTPPDIGPGTVSPDGKYLTFSTADSMPPSHVIRIMPTAGGNTRDLLLGVLQNFAFHARTPDGKTILFIKRISVANGEHRELWQVPFAGGEPRKIDVGKEWEPREVQVHPDGRRIVFTAGSTSKEVWVMENFLPGPKGK
jgi:Tol biopolymer transport system component